MKPYKLLLFALPLLAFDDIANNLKKEIEKQLEQLPPPHFSVEEVDDGKVKESGWESHFSNLCQSHKKLQIDVDEPQFHPEILENPMAAIGIIKADEIPAHTETNLETCIESGEYDREFRQTLEVTLVHESKKVKQCSGHEKIVELKWKGFSKEKKKSALKNKINELKQYYQADSSIRDYEVEAIEEGKNDFKCNIRCLYHHVNDTSCDHYQIVDIPGTILEKDEWRIDHPEEHEKISKNPNCKLVIATIEEGPATRWIDGKEIKRDVWAKKLLFECSPRADSPCAKYREQGGRLVSKECVQRASETDECEFWKKTYDLGKSHAPSTKYTYADGITPIWGLNGELIPDPQPKAETSMSQVFAVLKSISDMPLGENEGILDLDKKPVWNGTVHQCRCNHTIGELYDCCKKMTGITLFGLLEPCKEREFELKKLNDEGRCHKVPGSYLDKSGLFEARTKVYCCYPTKLLRIFNEQARKQMNLGWGTAKQPNCQGFSLEEMDGKVDVGKMDFSEMANEIGVNEQALEQEIRENIRKALDNPDLKNIFLEEPTP